MRSDEPLDTDAIAARVLCLRPPPGATVYNAINARSRVLPVASSEPREVPATLLAAIAAVRSEIEAAVARALAGARRVAVLTGGGVDSSALLALAVRWARQTGSTAFAIALDFGGDGDDRPFLKELVTDLGCDVIRVRPEDAAARVEQVRSGIDAAPFTLPGGAIELEAFVRAHTEGADRVLMGIGADQLFDGDPRALSLLVRRGRFAKAIDSAHALRGFARPRAPVASWILRPLLAAALPRRIRRARALRGAPVAPPWAATRLRTVAEAELARVVNRELDAGGELASRITPSELEPLEWHRHQKEVAAGIPRRDPYLDPELVRFVASLPPEWLLAGDVRRGLFREAIRGLVPESIRTRQTKAAFEEGFTRFVQAAGGFDAFRELARATALADLGLVEPAALSRAFEELAARPIDSWGWGDVWPAIAVESFLRTRDGGGRR